MMPGDPTPVQGGQTGLATGAAKGCLHLLGELTIEAVGTVVLGVATTASLAAVFVLAQLARRHSPAASCAFAALAVLGVAHGIRRLRRPKEQRTRLGRRSAAVTGGLGLWLLACLGYASFGTALDLGSGL
ncbi:hypothetical protein [Kitasatospora sp. NPDC092286]